MATQSRTSKSTGRTTHRVLWRLNGERNGDWQTVTVGHTKRHGGQAKALDAWLRDVHGYKLDKHDPRIADFLGRAPAAEPAPNALTVRQVVAAYIAESPDLKPSTRVRYRATLNRLGDLADVLVADLDRAQVNRWFVAHNAKGYAPKTMALSKAVLMAALRDHADVRALFRDVRYDANARLTEPHDLTDEQSRDLIEHAGNTGLSLLIRVAIETGMRRGELAGLVAGDVDLERGVIRVRHQLADRANDSRAYGFERASLKGKLRRDIPITPALADALALVAELPEDAPVFAQSGAGNWHAAKDWWLFDALGRRLNGVVAATPSVPNTVTMHDFRHTAGMRWLRAGASLGLVSKLLGHANIGITHAAYSHWNDADAAELIRGASLTV